MTADSYNGTSVIRGPAIMKAGRLDSYESSPASCHLMIPTGSGVSRTNGEPNNAYELTGQPYQLFAVRLSLYIPRKGEMKNEPRI